MKKLFLSLFVGLIGLISFCSAGQYTFQGNVNDQKFYEIIPVPQSYFGTDITIHCVFSSANTNCGGDGEVFSFNFYFAQIYSSQFVYSYLVNTNSHYGINCSDPQDIILDYDFSAYIPPTSGPQHNYYGVSFIKFNNMFIGHGVDIPYSCTFSGYYILDSSGGGSCPECPNQYTSEECQAEYGLVTSGVLNQCNNNLLSCQSSLSGCQSSLSGYNNSLTNCSNNLNSCNTNLSNCLQSNCPIDTGNIQRSALYINQIQHLGGPVINIDIPDNVYWDYTTSDEEFNLYVGSGYDQDYIDGIISINSYSPTSEDFTNVFVSGLTLIMPYIIFALFIVFLWKLIKRIFK